MVSLHLLVINNLDRNFSFILTPRLHVEDLNWICDAVNGFKKN